ncbi:C-type mannose receptor 2 isoform X2 [Cyclopterus lumpus]|nr:C-type mannose receptor 2 isoform X2 [Cyclopterus lumpus]
MWHWSWPDQKLDFFNWKVEPQMKNKDACATMDLRGEWIESDCGTQRSFVCRGNSDTSGLIFVAEIKSWRDAQNHCRGLLSELISIHSAVENEAVRNVSGSQIVWIGLFKDPWKWSDGSKTSFRYWKPSQPDNLNEQNCAAAIFKDNGQWNDLKCSGKRSFVCRGARKSIPTTTYQTSTQQTTTNLATLQSTSTQYVITNHFTLATTNQSPTTTITTEEATTSNELTTPNATDFVSSTPNTELNNTTTEMSTVTPTRQPPQTTAQVTTGSTSTLTTLMGTSAQTTTPSSTPKPTENSQSFSTENLILIQENMTWIEAMGYCREHHLDLVHITTEDIQGKVAETARNATSPHVWLGLRYTCKLNFWFWTKSTSGCYHNWAPGQGSERKYDCGVTGAIEATGRQQWVGLPETEQLNFICYTCTG